MTQERAVLAGGCFWGVQDLFRKYPGVISTRVGYTGGNTPQATYRNHGYHAEAVEILFDPETITFRQILEFFFQIHDPTTRNRQGNDMGTSYRSAIYYTTDEQRRVAEDTIADFDASGLWPDKVVTEVARRATSGKPSRSTRVTCCAILAATPANSSASTGRCRGERPVRRIQRRCAWAQPKALERLRRDNAASVASNNASLPNETSWILRSTKNPGVARKWLRRAASICSRMRCR